MNRAHLQSELRRGVAPLELVMVLPIMWLLFICVLYVGWSAMIAFQNESICRNTAWKQRTEPGSDVKPFVFGNATAGIIEEERTEPIKTGLILDRWKHTAKAKNVVLAHTWDFNDVSLDKSQLYTHQPFLQLLNGDNLNLKKKFEGFKGRIVAEFNKFLQNAIESYVKEMIPGYKKFGKGELENILTNKSTEAKRKASRLVPDMEALKDMAEQSKVLTDQFKAELDTIHIGLATLAVRRMDSLKEHWNWPERLRLRQAVQQVLNSNPKIPAAEIEFKLAFDKEVKAHLNRQHELEKEFDKKLEGLRAEDPEREISEVEIQSLRKDFMDEKQRNETNEQKANRLVSENLDKMFNYWDKKNEMENARDMINTMNRTQDYQPNIPLDESTYYDD